MNPPLEYRRYTIKRLLMRHIDSRIVAEICNGERTMWAGLHNFVCEPDISVLRTSRHLLLMLQRLVTRPVIVDTSDMGYIVTILGIRESVLPVLCAKPVVSMQYTDECASCFAFKIELIFPCGNSHGMCRACATTWYNTTMQMKGAGECHMCRATFVYPF
eukprot:gene12722-15968_t